MNRVTQASYRDNKLHILFSYKKKMWHKSNRSFQPDLIVYLNDYKVFGHMICKKTILFTNNMHLLNIA